MNITNIAEESNEVGGQIPYTDYKFALKTSVQDLQEMDREQLLAVATELICFISLIVSIVRNPWAMATSRLVALDVLFEAVKRSAKQGTHDILSTMPVLISSKDTSKLDKTIAGRLGIHYNTVSEAVDHLQTAGLVEKSYREERDRGEKRTHLDVTLQPEFVLYPESLMDKNQRKAPTEKREKPVPVCSLCGSAHVDVYHVTQCAESTCGHLDIKTIQQQPPTPPTLRVVESEPSLDHDEIQAEPLPKPLYSCKHCRMPFWVLDEKEWICEKCWTPAAQSECMSWFYRHNRLSDACDELERAARYQVDPPEWVQEIMTDVGWNHWMQVAEGSKVQ